MNKSMRSRLTIWGLVAVVISTGAAVGQVPTPAPAPAAPAPAPGWPPPSPEVMAELQQALADALRRFRTKDMEGVLDYVSERYHTGPLRKDVVRQQLRTIYATHDSVRADVRIDHVLMVNDRAWVYSTGQVDGRVKFIGTEVTLFWWTRQPEVAWRENGRWRLIGDQQG